MPTLPPSYIERAGWHALIKPCQNVTELGVAIRNIKQMVQVGAQLSILAQIGLQMVFTEN